MSAARKRLEHLFATSMAEQFLELGQVAGLMELEPGPGGRAGGGASRRGR